MSGNIHQTDKDKLKGTVTQAEKDRTVTGDVTVIQPDETKLKSTVTQAAKDRTVTGAVTANAGTNLNTSGLAISNTETDDDSIPNEEVRETANVLLHGYSSVDFEWKRVYVDDYHRLHVFVAPSGDMARKAYYDRNMNMVVSAYAASVAAHAWTVRWTYTVPADHSAMHAFGRMRGAVAIATATKLCGFNLEMYDGSSWGTVASLFHYDNSGTESILHIALPIALAAAEAVRGSTYSNDTVNHTLDIGSYQTEFDE